MLRKFSLPPPKILKLTGFSICWKKFLFAKFFIATCITLVCSIILLFVETIYFKYKTKVFSKKISKAQEDLGLASNIPLLNLKSVKIINNEDFFFENYCEKFDKTQQLSKDLSFYNSIPPYVTEPFIIIILLVLLTIISLQHQSESSILVASYALVVSATFRLAPTISRIQVNITGINSCLTQVKELVQLYKEFKLAWIPANTNPPRSIPLRGILMLHRAHKAVLAAIYETREPKRTQTHPEAFRLGVFS